MNALRKEGYVEDFNLQKSWLQCSKGQRLTADDFKVDRFYRFEGESNPSDAAILYAISSERHGLKGILVNAYGIYSDPAADALMQKLDVREPA